MKILCLNPEPLRIFWGEFYPFFIGHSFSANLKTKLYQYFEKNNPVLVGPSGETQTPGILLPRQVRYQLRYTRI